MRTSFLHSRLFLILILLLGCGYLSPAFAELEDPFDFSFEVQKTSIQTNETIKLVVHFDIPQNYYLYADKLSLELSPNNWVEKIVYQWPEPTTHFDPFLNKNLQVYFDHLDIPIEIIFKKNIEPGTYPLSGHFKYQGCSNEVCYLPMKQALNVKMKIQAVGETTTPSSLFLLWQSLKNMDADALLQLSPWLLYFIALLAGILTCFTPCVYPVIPITMLFIGAREGHKTGHKRIALFVVGVVLMFSILGSVSAAFGLGLGFLFQSKWFVLGLAMMFLLFALGIWGIIPFELPSNVQNYLSRLGANSNRGALLTGLTIGFITSPCVGPLMGPFLVLAARSQSQWFGFSLLSAFGLGMGLFFALFALVFEKFHLRLSGSFYKSFKIILGILLLLPSLFYFVSFGQSLTINGKTTVSLKDNWYQQWDVASRMALQENKKIFIDFYANWCPPCVEMEKLTFSQEIFRKAAESWILLKIDCSIMTDECAAMTEKFKVLGLPTMLIVQIQGEEAKVLKQFNGFIAAPELVEILKRYQ